MKSDNRKLEEIKKCLTADLRLPPSPEQAAWLIAQFKEKDREIARLQEAIKILNALRRNDQKLTEKAEARCINLEKRIKKYE